METTHKLTTCKRCGKPCKVDPIPGSKATILKRSASPKDYCAACAVHDWLRNTYPVNVLMARSGPKALALPHIQQQIMGIAQHAGTDATPGDIDWERIIENWELPFPTKVKPRAENPMSEEDIKSYLRHERKLEVDGLTEQERRARAAAERDTAIRDFIHAVNPGSKGRRFEIRDNGRGCITVDYEDER